MRPQHTPSKKSKKGTPHSTTEEFEKLLSEAPQAPHYVLRLYITGSTPRSMEAIANIKAMCEEFLANRYELEVIDIYQQPEAAFEEQIIAAPTLIKELPFPPSRMVGNLSNLDKILVGLNLIPRGELPMQVPETKWVEL